MSQNGAVCRDFVAKSGDFVALNDKNLPKMAQDLIHALGFDTALNVIEQLGGASWRISYADNSKERAAIEALIGKKAYMHLQNAFAGETLYIPKCHKALLAIRNQTIKTTLKQCADNVHSKTDKIRQLVREFKLSDRRIAQIAGENKPDNPQEDLFN